MNIADEHWSVMVSLLPAGWQEMPLQSGAFERLREFSSPGVLLRPLLLHVARGYSLREMVVRAELAHWADVSDVALLKRMRKSENWLRFLCVELPSGKLCELGRRSCQHTDTDCGQHDRQRVRQDGEPVADSIWPATTESR
jgi:hypothetical protein